MWHQRSFLKIGKIMYAIKINNRLARDDKGCIYKYSSKGVAEEKAKLFIKNLLIKNIKYKIVMV